MQEPTIEEALEFLGNDFRQLKQHGIKENRVWIAQQRMPSGQKYLRAQGKTAKEALLNLMTMVTEKQSTPPSDIS